MHDTSMQATWTPRTTAAAVLVAVVFAAAAGTGRGHKTAQDENQRTEVATGGQTPQADGLPWQPAPYQSWTGAAVYALNAPTPAEAPGIGPAAVAREVTAYNSVEWQTDATPCIGAGGDVCAMHARGVRVCAANWAPLGSVLRIQSGPGHRVDFDCTVADRMNARFPNGVDLFMGGDVEAARKFGRQILFVTLTARP